MPIAMGPVFDVHNQFVDANGRRLVYIVTRPKSNVVGYFKPPKKTGLRGRPRIYGVKHNLMTLFETRADAFEKTAIERFGRCKTVTSSVPSEEIVKSVIKQEYYHNLSFFKHTPIYRVIIS